MSLKETKLLNFAKSKLLDLKRNYKKKDFNLNLYFDLAQWASFFSLIDFFSTYHGAIPRNVKLYYNPSTQLFEPIVYDNHMGGTNYTHFSFIAFHPQNKFNYSKCGFVCDPTHIEWFHLFFKNKEFIKLFVNHSHRIIDKFNNNYFANEINEVENFNDAMYSVFAPSDRVFIAGILPYYMDLNHLKKRSKLIKAKIKQLKLEHIGNINQFNHKMIENNFCLNEQKKNYICNNEFVGKKIKIIDNFNLSGKDFVINDDEILILTGKTYINQSKIYSKNGSMFVQLGGEIFIKDSIIKGLKNIDLNYVNWSGAVNFIKSSVILDNVFLKKTKGEDSLNVVNSLINIKNGLNFENIEADAFDSDFSEIKFDILNCLNIGNDCFDTSGSKVKGKNIYGDYIGDKLLSFGEKSLINLNFAQCSKCGIGVAVKDSSFAEIGSIDFDETKLPISVFKKKKNFSSATLKINMFKNDFNYKDYLIGFNSKIFFLDDKLIGFESDKDIKDKQYGNEFGKSS